MPERKLDEGLSESNVWSTAHRWEREGISFLKQSTLRRREGWTSRWQRQRQFCTQLDEGCFE